MDPMNGLGGIELGIPDIVHKHAQPITLPELVSALQISPTKTSYVYRLIRMLLLKDESNCLTPFVLSMTTPVLLTPWHFLGDWFGGNELYAFESAYGMNFWDYGEQNPEFSKRFCQAMASDSQMANLAIKDCKPIFEGLDSLVDVGRGTGSFSRIVFPNIKCTVLDLPHVVANLPETRNLKFVGGDMFQSIPPADAFLFKWMFHAFGDEDCVKVLKKCREAMATKEGKERNEKEWERLFLEAGFSHYKITPMFGLRSLIEVYP
ncbi:hypothetical protein Pint_10502 [Pistacia integerrima]|uniref:Uncharacterized protein n=1 Tax=Pistacia integerrima TaxID=434235 RepID=A0ACC0XFZ6_9ROSI|nr:hypothetical protein Pint_10502 [Pistacia integerrima]